MKILILIKRWSGGVGAIIKSQCKELKRLGYSVEVISREDDLHIFSTFKSIKLLRNIISKKNFDILFTQDWNLALPFLIPKKLFPQKHFCCFHGIQPGKSKLFQLFVGQLLGKHLIVVGNILKDKFPKSNLIYNGVDLKLFRNIKGIKRIQNSVGFVNWKTEEYNYNEIKTACELCNKKLIIAENISYDEMPKFYSSIETFISLPPEYTGFNLSWIEAIACKVPIIIGNNFGIGSKLNIIKANNKLELIKILKTKTIKNYNSNLRQFDIKYNISKLLKLFFRNN